MRVAVEAGLFLGLAAAVHLGAATVLHEAATGAESSGAGGDAALSLEAAPESLAALAQSWRTPPQALRRPDAPAAPQPDPAADPAGAAAPAAEPAGSPPPAPPRQTPREAPLPAPGPQIAATPAAAAPAAPEAAERTAPAPVPESPATRHAPAPAGPSPGDPPAPPMVDTAAPPPPPATVAAADDAQQRPQPRPAPQPETPARRDPAPDSAGRPAQRAHGDGGGPAAGARGDAPAATLSPAARQSLIAGWGGAIRARIERAKRTPEAARSRRVTGTVVLRMEVARDGRLTALGIAQSSGHDALDRAALAAVRNAGRLPAAPADLPDPSARFDLPVSFR